MASLGISRGGELVHFGSTTAEVHDAHSDSVRSCRILHCCQINTVHKDRAGCSEE
jgi:hypothetical protein